MTVKNIYPWGNFVVDDATDLPQPPEPGMFWRVTKPFLGLGDQVQLRKKTWYGSRKLDWHPTRLNRGRILDAAAYILYKMTKSKDETSLRGDYPPKSL